MTEAFQDGQAARAADKWAIENPFFGEPENVDLFNAWSDGWIEKDIALRLANTRLRKKRPPYLNKFEMARIFDNGTTRGLTASWG
jgi:hypothetical protein